MKRYPLLVMMLMLALCWAASRTDSLTVDPGWAGKGAGEKVRQARP